MDRSAQIRAFEAELAALAAEGITLDPAEVARIRAHHASLGGVIPDERLSLGMRLASFVGACALGAAVFFLFYRFWGGLTVPVQVLILIAGPVALLGVTHALHHAEKTGYFAALAALAAFAAFVLDLGALGKIFNLPPTPHAFLAWGLFGIVVGIAYEVRLAHFAGLVSLGLWVTALPGWAFAEDLPDLFTRGEALALAGAVFLLVPVFLKGYLRTWRGLDLRIVGMIGLFLGIFILSVEGSQSWLPWDHDLIEGVYQFIGFAAGGVIVYFGVRERLADLANGGMIFITILCLVKAADWWWALLPRWLFFLVLAGFAIGVMMVLKRVNRAVTERAA